MAVSVCAVDIRRRPNAKIAPVAQHEVFKDFFKAVRDHRAKHGQDEALNSSRTALIKTHCLEEKHCQLVQVKTSSVDTPSGFGDDTQTDSDGVGSPEGSSQSNRQTTLKDVLE